MSTPQCNFFNNNMLTLELIRAQLQDRRLTVISEKTGLHPNTLRDIRNNADCNPSHRVLAALSTYIENSAQAVLRHG
jgi:N-acetylmuramic acid 6-phosphate (MurNAc-6-P) etherase